MRGMGWTLISIGLGLVLWSIATQTSVHTDMDYIPGVGLQEAKDVLNLGLLQKQMMLLHSGLAAFIAGTVAVCIGGLRAAMRRAGAAKYMGMFEFDEPKQEPTTEQSNAEALASSESEAPHAE